MKSRYIFNLRWLIKAALCVVFIGFMTVKSRAQLGIPPLIIVQPLGLSVQNGGTAVFTVVATSLTPMTFDWRLNGKSISPNSNITIVTGTTNMLLNGILGLVPINILTIKNVASTNAGVFSVRINNGIGSVTSSAATLIVLLPSNPDPQSNTVSFVSTETGMVAGGFKLQLSGPVGSNVVIEATSDLKNWTPVYTNQVTTGSITYTDAVAKTASSRYYRAKIQ